MTLDLPLREANPPNPASLRSRVDATLVCSDLQGGVRVLVDGGLRVRQGVAPDHHAEGHGQTLPRRRQAVGVRVPRAGAGGAPRSLRRQSRKHRLRQLRGNQPLECQTYSKRTERTEMFVSECPCI